MPLIPIDPRTYGFGGASLVPHSTTHTALVLEAAREDVYFDRYVWEDLTVAPPSDLFGVVTFTNELSAVLLSEAPTGFRYYGVRDLQPSPVAEGALEYTIDQLNSMKAGLIAVGSVDYSALSSTPDATDLATAIILATAIVALLSVTVWSPVSLSGESTYTHWAGSGIETTGSDVDVWGDLGPNEIDLASTGGTEPEYVASLADANDKPAVYFELADFLEAADPFATEMSPLHKDGGVTYFWVVRPGTSPDAFQIFWADHDTNVVLHPGFSIIFDGTGETLAFYAFALEEWFTLYLPVPFAGDTVHSVAIRHSGEADRNFQLWIDKELASDVNYVSAPNPNPTNQNPTMGKEASTTDYLFEGHMLFNQGIALRKDDDVISRFHSWVTWEYGIGA